MARDDIIVGSIAESIPTMAGMGLSPQTVLVGCLGLILPLLLPLLQFGLVYRLWEQHAVVVKRDYCQNSCWDTVFKVGTRECIE